MQAAAETESTTTTARIGFIGTGGRSVCYARTYAETDGIEVVAMADPLPQHRQAMAEQAGLTGDIAEYDDWRDLLNQHPDLDGMVISSPNFAHADQAVACLELGMAIALEKPLATTLEDCDRIMDAERANNGQVLVGFVLRSTPFYGKIHELIGAGVIGQVISIQADELPGWGVTSIMNRGSWRRRSELSGGSMLEKSCHDMDILNWLMNSRPLSLNCYGGRRIFNPNPLLPDTCDDCTLGDTCQYHRKPTFSAHEDEGEEILHEFMRQDNECIYNVDKDVADVQAVNIEYANGAVANFMLNFNCSGPRSGRNFHAVGQKGRLWGDLHESKVYHYDNLTDTTESYDCTGDGSGHGGGDRRHALELKRMIEDRGYRPTQSAAAGYLSAAMCFACDLSMIERRRLDFRYGAHDRITLV